LQVRYRFEYEVGRPLPEVKAFFSEVSNLERVWPRDYALKVIEGPDRVVRGARYLVRGRLLGQPVLLPFTVLEEDETASHHVLEDVLGGKLEHWAFPRPVDYIAKLAAWFLLWFFTHDLAHFAVGALTGVRFSHYYVGLSNLYRSRLVPRQIKRFIVALGIKIDREKTKAGRLGYFAMFVAGPLASMISPFLVPLHLFASGRVGVFTFLLLALSVANVAFTVPFSTSVGCIAKGLRALRKG
jgi:hypothetical protein